MPVLEANNYTLLVLKGLSLGSLLLSLFVYSVHIFGISINTDGFLFLHATALVSCFSMLYYSWKKDKGSKTKRVPFSFSTFLKRFHTTMKLVKILTINHKLLVGSNVIFIVLVLIFSHFHVHNFLNQVNELEQMEGPSDFIALASGHWVIFSAIPTMYFFFILPLSNKWSCLEEKMKV